MQETAQQYIQRILAHVDGQDAMKVQRATPPKLKKLIRGLTPKQLRWKPAPGKWSIAEILAHLADAEIVGSWRMRLIIGASGTTIQAFDQDAWASAFQYDKRDAKHSLDVYRVLRENNLAMLKALPKESWENYGMPTWSACSRGMIPTICGRLKASLPNSKKSGSRSSRWRRPANQL
jgi:DinB superfamily